LFNHRIGFVSANQKGVHERYVIGIVENKTIVNRKEILV
jgi:hypothetical protein